LQTSRHPLTKREVALQFDEVNNSGYGSSLIYTLFCASGDPLTTTHQIVYVEGIWQGVLCTTQ